MLLLAVSCVAALLSVRRVRDKMEFGPDISALIQGMVREQVAAHWPFVRAHEHRMRPDEAGLVAVDEWVVFSNLLAFIVAVTPGSQQMVSWIQSMGHACGMPACCVQRQLMPLGPLA